MVALGPMVNLEHLDLTRNNIGELPTGTFRQLSGLKILKLAVNSMRQVKLIPTCCYFILVLLVMKISVQILIRRIVIFYGVSDGLVGENP